MASEPRNYPDYVFVAYDEDFSAQTYDIAVSLEPGNLVGRPVRYIRHDLSTRPAPAATDTGLETVEHQYWRDQTQEWLPTGFPDRYRKDGFQVRELVTRSQAEELLAAEIELKQHWKDEAERFRIEFEKVAYDCRLSQVRVEALEAKLAAAEKALEAIEDHAARCFSLSTHSTIALAYLQDIQDEARAVLGGKP